MRQPGPDEPVHITNLVYRQLDDGRWEGWVEPLGGGDRRFQVTADTANEARDRLTAEICAGYPEPSEEWEEFLRTHSRRMLRRDVPNVEWPPATREWRRLDLIEEAQRLAALRKN